MNNSNSGKSLKQVRADRNRLVERVPLVTFLARKILNWPRIIRILIIGIFAVAITAAVFPLVDYTYLTRFYDENYRILPSFVSTAIGIIMYVVGWWLLVGTRGEARPERLAVLVYMVLGFGAIIFVLGLMMNGYYTANLPIT
jgi:hypothetical protein